VHYNIRVAEVLRAVSRATDVAAARPFGFGQRVAVAAMAIAERVGMPDHDRRDLLVAALLHGAGTAAVGGPVARLVLTDERRHLAEFPVDAIVAALAEVDSVDQEGEAATGVYIRHHLQLIRFPELTRLWLSRAGLAEPGAIAGLLLERHDAHGPRGLAGDQLPLTARVLSIAYHLASVRRLIHLPEPFWHGQVDLDGADWIRALSGRIFDPALVDVAAEVWHDPSVWRAARLGLETSNHDDEDTADRRLAVPASHTLDPAASPSTVDDVSAPHDGHASAEHRVGDVDELLENYVHGLHDVDEDVPDIDRYIDHLLYAEFGGFLEPTSPVLDAWLSIIGAMSDAKAALEDAHSRRVATLAQDIGLALELSDTQLLQLRLASLLFGAGRLGLPSTLLESAASLTPAQRRLLQEYPRVTRSVLAPLAPLGELVTTAALHAERLDGSGYPEGRSGDEIPLAARIVAVAATYMALISERPYRPAYARSRALAIVQAQSGALFDGLVTDSLEAVVRGQI